MRELIVVKRSGRKVLFDRDKLDKSIDIALRKRPIEPERIERMVSGVVRQLESLGETEVILDRIGELVMEALREPRPRRLCPLRIGLSRLPRGCRLP